MRFADYIGERVLLLLLHIFCAIGLILFLYIMELPSSSIMVIILFWIFILTVYLASHYIQAKRKYNDILQIMNVLDQKYLISEMLKKPTNQIELIYYNMLSDAAKDMTEEVGKAQAAQLSYKEYIEKWIHEIKSPITAIQLICKNHKSEETNRIEKELQSIYYLVEQALYYARSEAVEQDYFIKQIRLFNIVQSVIMNHRTALMDHQIYLEIDETDDMVWTDEKWVSYTIGQIISNSIKYCRKENARIHIFTKVTEQGIFLSIEDNGIGISDFDLPRIFDKGFTGTNRANKQSTGLGLYLCKKLCVKLGLNISAESLKDQFTRITLYFPIGKLTSDVSQRLTNL